ncbi:unnamed protein product [Mortierella alpina]
MELAKFGEFQKGEKVTAKDPFSTGVEYMVDFDLKRLGVDPTKAVIHMEGPPTAQKILARITNCSNSDESDLMHRPVTRVLILVKGGLELIGREDVLKAFRLDEDQLQLLAVVSTSAFFKPVKYRGFIKHHKAIRRQLSPTPRGGPNCSSCSSDIKIKSEVQTPPMLSRSFQQLYFDNETA